MGGWTNWVWGVERGTHPDGWACFNPGLLLLKEARTGGFLNKWLILPLHSR